MGVTVRTRSGKVLLETFNDSDLDSDWEVLPNNPARWSISSGSLRLEHGVDPIYFIYKPLTNLKKFVMDVHNEYNPQEEGDVGGLIVFTDENDSIEVEEYFDPVKGTSVTYPWLRVIRDYNTYSVYWSDDGVNWNLVGSIAYDGLTPKIGIYLKGTVGVPMDIETVRVCGDTKITVTNLTPGSVVVLKDANGNEVRRKVCRRGMSHTSFDMNNLPNPFVGKFSVSLDGGSTWRDDKEPFEMWGGDEYSLSIRPDLYFIDDDDNEVPLDNNIETFLGHLTGNLYKEIEMIARNNFYGDFVDVVVTLIDYKGTGHFSDYVGLSLVQGGTYTESISLGTITEGSEARFWLRVDRDTSKFLTELFFSIRVDSQFRVNP